MLNQVIINSVSLRSTDSSSKGLKTWLWKEDKFAQQSCLTRASWKVCTACFGSRLTLFTASVHNPEERCCFVVEEPPILKQLESTFAPVERPLSSFIKNVRFVRKISLRVLYAIILLSIISNGIRAGLQANVDYVDVIILRQVNLVVAMSLILCPTGIAHIVKSAATAKLMAMFDMLQGSTAKGDAVGDAANFDVEDQHKHITGLPFSKY